MLYELKTTMNEVTVEDGPDFLTFTSKHEWLKIPCEDLNLIKGMVLRTFAGSSGIYMVMQKSSSLGAVDEGYILLLNTVKEDTGANKILFAEISRDEAIFLRDHSVDLWH